MAKFGRNSSRDSKKRQMLPCKPVVVAASFALAVGAAFASPPTINELGFSYTIVARGPTMTVDIRLKPTRSFDTVKVEAASGVASLTSTCGFSSVAAGGSYVCRVDVAGKPSDAAMTINIVAQQALPGGPIPHTEIQHLSLTNTSFVRSSKRAAVSMHALPSSITSAE
jgi:hypothetical protein